MPTEENKAILRRWYEVVYNQGNSDAVDEICDKNIISHISSDEIKGTESQKKFISMMRSAFPDIQFTIEDQIAEGDKVVNRWTFTGTHKGEYIGVSPTGKLIRGTGITIHRIANDRMVES